MIKSLLSPWYQGCEVPPSLVGGARSVSTVRYEIRPITALLSYRGPVSICSSQDAIAPYILCWSGFRRKSTSGVQHNLALLRPLYIRQTYFVNILHALQASQLIAETTVWSPMTALTPAMVRSTNLILNAHSEEVTKLFCTAEAIIERSYNGA